MKFDIDAIRDQVGNRVSALSMAEAILETAIHGVAATEHVVQIMIPLGNIDEIVLNRIYRMEVIHRGKTMRVHRVTEGTASNNGYPYAYRSYGFCVPETVRGPTEDDYRKAKTTMRDIERDALSRFNPNSILLEEDTKASQEKMIVEAPIGSGRADRAYSVVTRQELRNTNV